MNKLKKLDLNSRNIELLNKKSSSQRQKKTTSSKKLKKSFKDKQMNPKFSLRDSIDTENVELPKKSQNLRETIQKWDVMDEEDMRKSYIDSVGHLNFVKSRLDASIYNENTN